MGVASPHPELIAAAWILVLIVERRFADGTYRRGVIVAYLLTNFRWCSHAFARVAASVTMASLRQATHKHVHYNIITRQPPATSDYHTRSP